MIKTEKKNENTAPIFYSTPTVLQNRVHTNLYLVQYSEREEQ